MRKRYLSFLLSFIIFLTSFTPAFADSVEVLEPIMSGVDSVEEKDNHSSDSVFVLDSRDNNGKVIENKEHSGSVSMPNILEERDNKVKDNLNPYSSPKKVENIKDIVNPVKPQIEELSEREKAPAVKDTVDEKEVLNEGLEVSEPIVGEAVTGTGATRPAGGWETYEIGNGWTLGDFKYNGNTVTGFSQSGILKAKTNKDLIVPNVIPDNSVEKFDSLKPITTIGKWAFCQSKLRNAVIPEGVTAIEDYAFSHNQLTRVVIPGGVTTIGEFAFNDNQLTSIVIPEGVTTIGIWAFQSNQLTKLNIPLSLKRIGKGAFHANPGSNDKHQVFLYTVDRTNPNNLSDSYSHLINPVTPTDNTLFTFEGDILTGLSEKGLELLKSDSKTIFTIPYKTPSGEDVREIKESAFEGLEASFVFPIDPNKIEKIGDHAFFKNKVTELNFSNFKNLVEVGPYAFAHNEVKTLVIPESLKTVGNYAFRDNLIREVDTKNIETIGEGAFSNNRIEKLTFGDALTTIGSHSFEQNDLVKVNISKNVTNFGKSVFAFNNRYVKVETENPLIKTEKTYRGFGHVVNPVIIKVKYIDKDTKEEILDSKTMGEDLTVEGGVFILGEENIFYPEKIKGYFIQDEVKFTPDKDNYELTLEYTSLKKKPTIEITGLRMINTNEDVNKELLLSFVKATDLTGKDISNRITVTPETIDTSTGGLKKVTYSVEDEFGNTIVKDVDIPVAIDWFKYPIGNGWVLGDFTYIGNIVTGFSEQGKEKVRTNKDLILPSVVPEAGVETFDKLKPVTKIKDGSFPYGAFSSNQLTSVVIPDSVTAIGDLAFAGNQLTRTVISNNVTTIGEGSFYSNQLTNVVIPDSVVTIGEGAFSSNRLTSVVISPGVTRIGKSSFFQNRLTSVVIPDSVVTIGASAFSGNQLMKAVISNSVTTIEELAFNSNKLTNVVIPKGVTTIGAGAFSYNELTSIVIPEGVTTIREDAFQHNELTSIVIPDSVTTIGERAFENNKLTSVVVPSGSIGVRAFYNNLLTDVVIGDGVKTIGEGSFAGYRDVSNYKGKNPGNQIKNLQLGISVESIGNCAFYKNQLMSVVIPDSVTTIGDYAFYNNQLTSVVIPDSVTAIGNSAFESNKLTSVVIGNNVPTIGEGAFSFNRLTSVVIPDSVTTIEKQAFQYNQLTSVVIPEGVTTIGDWAFYRSQLTNVVIPDSVTTIGDYAFSDNQLTSTVIGNNVATIGKSAFSNNQLTSLVIPNSVTTIGDWAFYKSQLTNVVIPDSVTTIENHAFSYNQLKSVVIGNSITTIEESTFQGNQLTNVVIPDSVTTIGKSAFSFNQLTSVVIPDSVTTIGEEAFYYNQLTSVVIPSNVTTIGKSAFSTNKLKKTYIPLSLKTIGEEAFVGNLGEDDLHNVTLLTPDRTNPNHLQNESTTKSQKFFPDEKATERKWINNYISGHIINPLSLRMNFVSEDGKILQSSIDNRVSEGQNIKFPNILGYEPRYIKETGEQITNNSKTLNSNGKNFVEWTILYKEKEITSIDGIVLETNLIPSLNQDPYKYNISEEQRLNIKFNVTKYVSNIGNSTILINIPSSINKDSIKIPAHRNIKNFVVEGGVIKISLQNITINTSVEIPVLFKMNENTTPENKKYELRTTLLNNNGDLVHSVLKNKFSGYYDKPTFGVLAGNVENAWLNGPRDVGGLGYVANNTDKKKVENAFDFNFGGEVKTGKYQGLKRNIESYKIETSLPTYVAYDKNGNELTKTAIFKQELNEGWVLNGNNLTYEKNKLNTNNPTLPKLVLSFPDAKDYAKVALSAKTVFVPKNKGENEEVIKLQDDIEIYATGKTVADSFLYSAPYVRYSPTRKRYIYDFIKDREKNIPWEIGFIENYKNSENRNLIIEVKELDNRFEYKSITNIGEETLSFKIYKNGKIVDEFILKPKEESKELPAGIDKIEAFSEKDKIININTKFIANIKAKNPKSELTLNQVRVSLSGTVDVKKQNGEEIVQSAKGYDSIAVAPFEYKLEARIDSSKKNVSVFADDIVNYTVGLQNFANGEKVDKEFFMEDLDNFKQIVILPENVQIKNITTTQGFRESPKSKYEIVNLNDGRQAVLFTTDKLIKDAENIANIEIFITSNMRDAKHATETYANWDNKTLAKTTEVNTPDNIKTIFGEIGSKDSLEYSIATVKAVYSEKYVKDEKGSYGLSSISYDGNIDYQLRVVNNTDGVRKNLEIVDILPFKGDNRGSQFDVFLGERATVPNGKVLYTTDKNPTANSSFTETYSRNATGIKVLVGTINANSTFAVDLKCKINLPSKTEELIELSNKFAFNDFARKDDLTDTFVKTNPVETKYMLGNASIEFSKFGLKKSIFFNNYKKKPLAGAEFELKDLDGNYIASAISDSNGKVIFRDIEAKDYIIREVKAPKGYEVGKDIRVLTNDYRLINGKIKAILEDEVINNAPRYGNLTINKVTVKNNPLPGIGFTIKGTDEGNKNFIKKVTTNNEGIATLKKIPEGNYIVEETESGRFIPAPPQTFKVEQTQGDIIPEDQEINLKFVNDKVKIKVNVIEYGANEDMPTKLTDLSKFNRKLVEGVKIGFGEPYGHGEEPINKHMVLETDKNGSVEYIYNLNSNAGEFFVGAGDSPIEYKHNKNVLSYFWESKNQPYKSGNAFNLSISDLGEIYIKEFSSSYKAKFIYGEINLPVQLKDVKAKIEINKVDDKSTALAGATFEVAKTGENDEVVSTQVSNASGKANFELSAGNYELKEISAPAGYYHEDFTKLITLPESAGDIKTIETDTDKINTELAKDNCDIYTSEDEYIVRHIKYKVVNKPLNVKALKYETILQNVEKEDVRNYEGKEGYKVIQNGNRYSVVKPLQGVKFDLYEDDIKVGSYQTGADGYINFNNHKFKENELYNLVETETLEGFKLEKAPTRINIKSLSKVEGFDGNININIENKRITGKIVISKYDEKTRTILPNQEFTLYDNTGKEISKKVTNSAGLIEFNNLTPGTYTFKETKVSGDYQLDDKTYTANITLNNLIHVEKIFNKPGSIDVKVTKVDDQGNPLEGVEFAIFKDGKMVYGPIKTNKDGIAIFKDVKIEDGLIVKETATIKDYQLNQEEITLDLQNTENQVEVKYTNHKAEQVLPDTGTLNELPFIGTAMLLLVISIFLRKRKVVIK